MFILIILDNENTLSNKNVITKTTRMKRKASTSIESRSVDSRDTDTMKNWNDLELQDLREFEKHQTNNLVSFGDGTWKKREEDNERNNHMSGDENNQLGNNFTFKSLNRGGYIKRAIEN